MKSKLLIAALLSYTMMGCQNSPKGQQGIVVQGEKPGRETRKQPVYSDTLNLEKAAMMITHYLSIKDALVADDAEKSAQMAKTILPMLEKDQDETLKIIYANMKAISLTKDLAKQRKHFYPLSEAVYAVMKTSKPLSVTLYKQYCPMAFEDTGAWWLSEEEEIMNPYFGDEMLHCGMVQEEF